MGLRGMSQDAQMRALDAQISRTHLELTRLSPSCPSWQSLQPPPATCDLKLPSRLWLRGLRGALQRMRSSPLSRSHHAPLGALRSHPYELRVAHASAHASLDASALHRTSANRSSVGRTSVGRTSVGRSSLSHTSANRISVERSSHPRPSSEAPCRVLMTLSVTCSRRSIEQIEL